MLPRHVGSFALVLIAALLVAPTVSPIPSLEAMSAACQAGPQDEVLHLRRAGRGAIL